MKKQKKYLYCSKCKYYPDEIILLYSDSMEETREWNEDMGHYELRESNIDNMEYKEFCADCLSELIEKNN